LIFFFFFFFLKGHPLDRKKNKNGKIDFALGGDRTIPKGHGGGLATHRSAGLGVAEPPLWPMGVVGPTQGQNGKNEIWRVWPLGGGQTTPVAYGGWFGHPKGKTRKTKFGGFGGSRTTPKGQNRS
jgi:hypothetical protein